LLGFLCLTLLYSSAAVRTLPTVIDGIFDGISILPLGELDAVDPALAQYSYLHLIDERDVPVPQSVTYPQGHQRPDWYSSLM
jgi:hypothetical protein